ncbi:hypothetical protein HanXRQr2_Chr06g0248041 [Helianthus annuus]|uniref:Uncharacterized protein n=1 Tax=Helianthus annuus TaxID=4232 RepID=A0A251UHA1_HELAN|nr:hypothetical protein HanXRQr2_Chr06g0248041 [Helianthus annuus]
MAMLWKKSKSALRLCDSCSISNSTTRSFLVSIVGKTEDERKALFEADNIRKGRSFKTVEEKKENVFLTWKCIRLIEHPDPNDKLAYRNLQVRTKR